MYAGLFKNIHKSVVFEDETTAHGTLVSLMDIAVEGGAATVYDYLILVNEAFDDDDVTDENDYGWTLEDLCRGIVIIEQGRPILILPKPERVLQIYDDQEDVWSYLKYGT